MRGHGSHLFEARGVAVAVTVKSVALALVSWPFGILAMLDPGAAVAGGADAAEPSTSAFVAEPHPAESTRAPVESRTPTAPPVEARPDENAWSAVAAPAYELPPSR